MHTKYDLTGAVMYIRSHETYSEDIIYLSVRVFFHKMISGQTKLELTCVVS